MRWRIHDERLWLPGPINVPAAFPTDGSSPRQLGLIAFMWSNVLAAPALRQALGLSTRNAIILTALVFLLPAAIARRVHAGAVGGSKLGRWCSWCEQASSLSSSLPPGERGETAGRLG